MSDLRAVCKMAAAERVAASQGSTTTTLTTSLPDVTNTSAPMQTSQTNASFIPPLPVKLPPHVDFTFPGAISVGSDRGLESLIDTGSTKSSSSGTPERRLNTKAMPLNTIYTPTTGGI